MFANLQPLPELHHCGECHGKRKEAGGMAGVGARLKRGVGVMRIICCRELLSV